MKEPDRSTIQHVFTLRASNTNQWCKFSTLPSALTIHPGAPGEPVVEVTWEGLIELEPRLSVFGFAFQFSQPQFCRGVVIQCILANDSGFNLTKERIVTPEHSVFHVPLFPPRGTMKFTIKVMPLPNALNSYYSQLHLFNFLWEPADQGLKTYILKESKDQSDDLVLVTAGGLSNRILALVSAIRANEKLRRRVIVLWPITENCTASADTIFSGLEPCEDYPLENVSVQLSIDAPVAVTEIQDDSFVGPSVLISSSNFWVLASDALPKVGNWPIWTTRLSEYFSQLNVKSDYWTKARALLQAHNNRPDVGPVALHVRLPRLFQIDRRAEAWEQRLFGKNRAIAEQLIQDLVLCGRTPVLLFTHDQSFLSEMKVRFGDNVHYISRDSDGTGSGPGASEDALVDLLSMTMCNTIITQAPSGFGFLAHLLGESKLLSIQNGKDSEECSIMVRSSDGIVRLVKTTHLGVVKSVLHEIDGPADGAREY